MTFAALLFAMAPAAILAAQPVNIAPVFSSNTWRFEVVSIHPTNSADIKPYGLAEAGPTPDGWRMANGSLALAILTAIVPQNGGGALYSSAQVQGMPQWAGTEHYDIDARIPDGDQAQWQDPAAQKTMLRTMLQAMLEERCKLVVHRDTKELPVYALVLKSGGPKFKETDPAAPHPGTPVPGGGSVVPEDDGKTMHFYGVSIASLAPLFSNWTGRPVQDNTGLTGRYDVVIVRPALGGPAAAQDGGPDSRPSISGALDDLGLHLESTKGSVETLVIDHVERPSGN